VCCPARYHCPAGNLHQRGGWRNSEHFHVLGLLVMDDFALHLLTDVFVAIKGDLASFGPYTLAANKVQFQLALRSC
jgi:hypothetical protein